MNPDSDPESEPGYDEADGSLSREILDDRIQWTFYPRRDRLMPRPLPPHPAVLCEFQFEPALLRIYPLVPYADNERYMQPKYDKLRCIQIERLGWMRDEDDEFDSTDYDYDYDYALELESLFDILPGAFVKRWKHGLGITKRYRSIVDVVERIGDVNELHLSEIDDEVRVTDSALVLPMFKFDQLCADIRRIDERAQTVATRFKTSAVYNSVADAFGLPERLPSRGRHPMIRLFSEEVSGEHVLSEQEQQMLLAATTAQARILARKRPEALAALRVDVDVANLDVLIAQFSDAIERPLPEQHWQRFFQQNPFALHLAFGHPLIQVQGQASVGGAKLSGEEGRFADFLTKNATTGNIAIFEIKKPTTPIIAQGMYRNTVFPPTTDLTGAVGQVLDQKAVLIKSLPALKESSNLYDLHAFSVRCCVIIGRTPADNARRKALEAFRGNSSAVDIITYDELLAKLEQLRGLLVGASD